MTKNHKNSPSPLYKGVVVAAADLEVEDAPELEVDVELVWLVPVAAVPVPVADPVEETCRADNDGSDVNCAERPVTFVQDEGTVVVVPETKLTAAHYKGVSPLNEPSLSRHTW
jgi:hypothetical protein